MKRSLVPVHLAILLATSVSWGATTGIEAEASPTPHRPKVYEIGVSQDIFYDPDASLAALDQRETIFIIDKSTSMGREDCKIFDQFPISVSRWEWCRGQMMNLASRASRLCSKTVRLVLFNNQAQAYDHTAISDIPAILSENKPKGLTNASSVLRQELEAYFRRRGDSEPTNPLMIVIISDGKPTNPKQLRQTIIEATHRMKNPGEITISYLTIGTDAKGIELASELDHSLIAMGAKYDIVHAKSFQDLRKQGLATALAETLSANADVQHHPRNYM